MIKPARFRQPRLLIVGCGDVGQRVLRALPSHWRVRALTSSAAKTPLLRQLGATPLQGNLDTPQSLRWLAGIAQRVLHLAPPAADDLPTQDRRTRHLVRALRRRTPPVQLVYGSTSGVYGDCAGALIAETRRLNPSTPRAQRRVAAEHMLRGSGLRSSILRIPGIYALDRAEGTPATRLRKGLPVPIAQEDVYTNHIHADDLARACVLALLRGKPQRAYHVTDDAHWLMGAYYALAAQLLHLPVPVQLPRAALAAQLTPMQMSFLCESRRLCNARLKHELRLRLYYSTPREGLCAPVLTPASVSH